MSTRTGFFENLLQHLSAARFVLAFAWGLGSLPLNLTLALTLILTFAMAPIDAAKAAEQKDVDLELVLAVDISYSMDPSEQKLQRSGYADAFRHPQVQAAIRSGLHGRIAVTYVEWASVNLQNVIVPWTIVATKADAEKFANKLEQTPLKRHYRTSISGALLFSRHYFQNNGYRGMRRVIDISGDGPNNDGPLIAQTRDKLIREGITINGLPLLMKVRQASGYFDIAELDIYYEDCVIGGPGSFLIPVTTMKGFAEAIRKKIILEIAGLQPEPRAPRRRAHLPLLHHAAQLDVKLSERPQAGSHSRSHMHSYVHKANWRYVPPRKAPRISCTIGEKMWQRSMNTTPWKEQGGSVFDGAAPNTRAIK